MSEVITANGRAAPRPGPFERYEAADIGALIGEYPLAWVCARGSGGASLLPLVGVFDSAGDLTELIGHFARSNPLHTAFLADPRATILFSGPQAYISPHHAGRRDWGPTWNFAQIRIDADIALEPERTGGALQALLDMVQQDDDDPWSPAELGERYGGMLSRIIGFRARVLKLEARFKLGQDEDEATLRSILERLPDEALARWMRRMNSERV